MPASRTPSVPLDVNAPHPLPAEIDTTRRLLAEVTVTSLRTALDSLIAGIPPGRVTTFGRLAVALGHPQAAVWVAKQVRSAVARDTDGSLPVWRVVRADGGLVVSTDRDSQSTRLRAEGVPIDAGHVPLDRLIDPLPADGAGGPLARLIAAQRALAVLSPPVDPRDDGRPLPRFVRGLDVSYVPGDAAAVAACVRIDTTTGACVASTTTVVPSPLPYIPTLLAWRELPALLAAVAALDAVTTDSTDDHAAEVCFVDGAGSLHPLRMGVATHLGLLTGRPTIGVTKSALGGQALAASAADGCVPIVWPKRSVSGGNRQRKATTGDDAASDLVALRFDSAKGRPLYVSSGTGIPLGTAARWARALAFGRHLPAPIYFADRFSREEARRFTPADSEGPPKQDDCP